ncbi:MAG TPA: protein kinase [Gemmatimonadales bacterium]
MHRHEPIDTTAAALGALRERYDIERELGRGGMAVVYLARERLGGRRVAIKLISARYSRDAEAVHRFAREARTAAALQHPNIVRTLAIEELDAVEALAIVSAFVPGDTLRDALRSRGAFPFDRAAAVLRDVAAALAHAHEMRIVHRDVKPENIFLVGDPGRALLADFGIARELDSDTVLTVEGSAIGTPTYMSPEQVDGLPVDGRTDVYALGLVGWEMLAGERPWQGETLYAVLHKQKHEQLASLAELRPDIPAYLLAAIEGAIEKDPARRWQSASEMLRRLTPAPARHARPAPVADEWSDPAASLPTAKLQSPRGTRAPMWRSVTGLVRPVAALLVVTAAVVLLVALLRRDGDTSTPPLARDDIVLEGESVPEGEVTGGELPRDGAAIAPPANEERVAAGDVAPPAGLSARCASPTAADQRACLLALIERQDVALDRSYQALVAELRRDAGGEREPSTVQALRSEQRTWLATRDSSCRAEAGGVRGGSWAVLLAPCFERQSSLREAELRSRLARLRDG